MNAMRVRMGMRARVRSGLWHGGPTPYGCTYGRERGRFVPRQDETVVVGRVFKTCAETQRLHAAKDALRREGQNVPASLQAGTTWPPARPFDSELAGCALSGLWAATVEKEPAHTCHPTRRGGPGKGGRNI